MCENVCAYAGMRESVFTTKFSNCIVCSVYNIKPVMLIFSILNVPSTPLVEQLIIIPFMFSGILEIVAVAVTCVPFIPIHFKTMHTVKKG